MWFLAFLLLVSVYGNRADDTRFRECIRVEGRDCRDIGLPDFPEDKVSFDAACGKLRLLAECVIPAAERCEKANTSLAKMKKSARYMENMCSPETDIYKALVNNMHCLKSVSEENFGDRCERINEKLLQNTSNDMDIDICLHESYHIACLTLHVGERCGSEAKEAALEVLMNISPHYFESCNEEQYAMMPDILNAFETAATELNAIEDQING